MGNPLQPLDLQLALCEKLFSDLIVTVSSLDKQVDEVFQRSDRRTQLVRSVANEMPQRVAL